MRNFLCADGTGIVSMKFMLLRMMGAWAVEDAGQNIFAMGVGSL